MTSISQYIDHISRKGWLLKAPDSCQGHSVHIVIPVYNGFESLKICLKSVISHTSPRIAVTILDDASTDIRVSELLHEISKNHPQFTVIRQTKNLGYLKNVNTFLSEASEDVVLLNADTQVTTGWLDELLAIAADPRVGAVCPLSDNATLLSINQNACKQISNLKHYHKQWYPIPTAVGFCMLIKEAVIKSQGGFDPYFDPGYGEECDYSMRIRHNGLQIACAPAAFVFHQGSQSFAEESEQLKTAHQKLLDLRWPQYNQEIAIYQSTNPTKLIELNLKNSSVNKNKILHVFHGIDNKGGVELFTKALLNRFDETLHHTILIPERNKKFKSQGEKLGFDVIEMDVLLQRPDHIIFNLPADLYHQSQDLYFHNLLLAGQFDLVHFHCLTGMGTAAWPLVCHQLEIPYQLFMHDHFGLCQIYCLSGTINNQAVFCGEQAMSKDSDKCQQCLAQKTQRSQLTTQSYMSLRQDIWKKIISHADFIYFPSRYLFKTYSKTYPEIINKSMIFKPCFYPNKKSACKPFNPSKINIAFVGQFGELKGAQLFIDFYHAIKNDKLSWHILGGINPEYKQQIAQTSINCYGPYESHELSEQLADIDLVVMTPVFPETYGITLTESWCNGKPVLAPDLGVYAERVKQGINGFLYRLNDLESLKSCFEDWIQKQLSADPIKVIEYFEDVENNPEVIQAMYLKSIKPSSRPVTKQGALIKKPAPAAWDLMRMWLEAPNTLEAAADWRDVPAGITVLVLGNQGKQTEITSKNIRQLLPEAIIRFEKDITVNCFADLNKPVLIIQSGTRLNENIGNWLNDFVQQKKPVSTADYALHNQQFEIYNAQFQQRFSWQNYRTSQLLTACVLVHPRLLLDQVILATLISENINSLIDYVVQTKHKDIHHFPHFCYTVNDAFWAQHWKSAFTSKNIKPDIFNKQVLILLSSQHEKSETLRHLKQQSIMQLCQVSIQKFSQAEKADVIAGSNHQAFDYVVLVNDNIRLSDDCCLENAIRQLAKSDLDVLSPMTNNSNNNGILAGKKWGASNHFVGVGRIRDTHFDSMDTAFEYDLLDDDVVIFIQKAFVQIAERWSSYEGDYISIYLHHWLKEIEQKMGLCYANGLHKKGIPSQFFEAGNRSLKQQREEIISSDMQFPKEPVYAHAFSSRNASHLDTHLTTFKTPKNLPRIVAYSHDDWASGFYRVKAPLSALAAVNHASVHFIPLKKGYDSPTPFEIMKLQADTLLLHHFFSDQQISALIQIRKQTSVRIILSIDDLLTEIPNYNPLQKLIPKDCKTRIKLVCSLVDGLIVSTQKLAQEFAEFHQNIRVIPNRVSKTIWTGLDQQQRSTNKLRVGWAGAAQHQEDLSLLMQVVKGTKEFCDWVFFGDKPEKLDLTQCEFYRPVELLHYPQKLAQLQLDVAVAPLVDNKFNHAKSNLKLIEYGVLGIPVIATDLTPYQNSPVTLLPNQAELWIKTLFNMEANRPELVQQGKTLQAWVQQNYILENHLDDWLNFLL